ncbi:MAG: hypothetical protein QOI56_1639, partial [Actinomycetota bacterium]|nr:hypothetical protein [Actinomycetota bacterium]
MIQVTDAGSGIFDDPSQGPFDGVEDTLIGVVNASNRTLGSLALSSDTDLFGFDGDGLCAVNPQPQGCPFGPTGYEGPRTTFSGITPDSSGGIVSFTGGMAPGATAYFSLEERLTATSVFSGGPGFPEQGGAPNPREHITTCFDAQPVNCATGVFFHEFVDFAIPGRGKPLAHSRTYRSSAAGTD